MLNIVLFGPPGAGKGTQSANIIKRYNLMHLSTGEILRNAIEQKTPRGIQAKKYMNRGELVPDEIVIGMIGRSLDEYRGKTNGFVFDGFPRTTKQASELDNMLKEKGVSITLVIDLKVEHNELMTRLEQRGKEYGRSDDQNIDVVKNRIRIYNESTLPVWDYYKAQKKAVSVDGMGAIDVIFKRISDTIDPIVSSSN
jgi:adenylate kinase